MKKFYFGSLITLSMLAGAKAQSVVVPLPDIDTYAGYTDYNTSDTFAGSGFVGIYPDIPNDNGAFGPSVAHLFGLENYNGIYSETELEASLAGLPNKPIASAYLNFGMYSGTSGNESVSVTSFSTAGTLTYNGSAPDDLGSLTASGITGGNNSINVTSLVTAAVGANQSWLGLFLTPLGPGENSLWTWTYGPYGGDANSANAALVINYAPDAASTMGLLGSAFGLLGMAARRFKKN